MDYYQKLDGLTLARVSVKELSRCRSLVKFMFQTTMESFAVSSIMSLFIRRNEQTPAAGRKAKIFES